MNSVQQSILITGGAGYIGSACAAALLADGYQVTIFDNFSTGQARYVPAGAMVVEGDITDLTALRAVFAQSTFACVIHCAAKKAVGESELQPAAYFQTNVVGAANVLQALTEQSVSRLIFSSTAAVYAAPADGALLTEQSPRAPQNVYGVTKHLVEQMIEQYARVGALPHYTIFRYFNVVGDADLHYQEQSPQNLFPLVMQAVRGERELAIFGTDYPTADGTGVRDYIDLRDLVTAHQAALATEQSGTYNLSTGQGHSVRAVIEMFRAVTGADLPVTASPRRPGDPAALVADPTHTKDTLGWQAQHDLRSMVESTVAAWRSRS